MKKITVQRFLTGAFATYKASHKLPLYQIKAVDKLMHCRTEAMGGHSVYCENGHLNGVWYNSCKHRSCPQCNRIDIENWLLKTESIVLDCPHHHWVFTLPHSLHQIWQHNRELCQTALFQAVRETLQFLCKDKKYLGAMPAIILSLHTWARNLTFHPHIHCLISHGGLDGEGAWITPKRKHFLPARVMMKIFRGKYLNKLKTALVVEQLQVPKSSTEQRVINLLNKWGRQDWVVHCTKQYEHGKGVVKYLARYIRGGAIKNSQLVQLKKGTVRFSYKSHQTNQREYLTLSHAHFMQRVLNSIAIPKKPQFQKVGLYHNKCHSKLDAAREQLGQRAIEKVELVTWQSLIKAIDSQCCRTCGGALQSLKKVHYENNKEEGFFKI